MTVATGVRRVATYERVSSEDQRERETIRTQTDEIARHLAGQPGVELVCRYVDDGVSGTIPLAERPDGRRLLADAVAGLFEEIWVYKVDRLGRDAVDLLVVRRRLDALGIALVSVVEGQPDLLGYDVTAVVADHYRREFARRSADGMNRAAREGRYTGGIVPFGYRVEGHKASARLVPDEAIAWADRSAADLVRDMYEHLALRGQSCRLIAADFNAAGIPTHYVRDGRGVRGRRTQGLWRAGRIRNLVVNPLYKGELRYGRRTERRDRDVIAAPIEALVSPALWGAAQDALAANRRSAKNSNHTYLLRGVIHCGICGLTLVGSADRSGGRYRCGGELVERGPIQGRCPAGSVRVDAIEPAVWADVERFLRAPGDVLDELDAAGERDAAGAVAEAESITLQSALKSLEEQQARAVRLVVKGVLSEADLRAELDRIAGERTALQARVAALQAPRAEVVPADAYDLLSEVRARLDAGLSDEQRQAIVRLLVGVVVHTEIGSDGKKTAKAVVTYRFPCVVPTRTGIREGLNYTTVRRVIEIPVGRQAVRTA
ncbi:MAG: recombinase family protein [Candidatus Limnocylindrales bacterium]|jgi:site-specific DNA recombinase